MNLLEVKGITKEFGGLRAVNQVSLQVESGEIVSLIGPNGAGKTTVFNLITGIYKLDQGSIIFAGKNITNLSPKHIVRAGISRTFQNIRLFGNLRVIENVLIGMHGTTNYSFHDILLRTHRFKREECAKAEQAIEMLKKVDLYNELDSYASSLPYGSQRRLEIVRAIATGAKLILLDEPAAGMNPQESTELMDFVVKLRNEGFTILMIEHDMHIVMNISDRICVMDYGKLIANGIPREIAVNKEVIRAYLGTNEDEE